MLFELMNKNLIPKKQVLFLTAREDLLNAFKKYVSEFNDYHTSKQIIVRALNEYPNVAM
jgi:hypothetical protein